MSHTIVHLRILTSSVELLMCFLSRYLWNPNFVVFKVILIHLLWQALFFFYFDSVAVCIAFQISFILKEHFRDANWISLTLAVAMIYQLSFLLLFLYYFGDQVGDKTTWNCVIVHWHLFEMLIWITNFSRGNVPALVFIKSSLSSFSFQFLLNNSLGNWAYINMVRESTNDTHNSDIPVNFWQIIFRM